MTIRWKSVGNLHYFTVVPFVFHQFVILENLSVFDFALSGVKGLRKHEEKRNLNNRLSET